MLKGALEATFSHYLENFIYTNGPRKKTRFQQFKIEFQHYMTTLEGLKNQKAIKTMQIYEALEIICKLSLN